MIALDPSDSLQHFPIPMAKFGLNPYGENRFRIVLAKSRRALVFGQWNGAGTPRAKWCRIYAQFGDTWILEEWQDAFTFAGCTAETWNRDPNLNILGAYPHRGEYVMIGNDGFNPHDFDIEKLITLVHAADKYSWAEKLNACRLSADADSRDRHNQSVAIVRDALPAFGHAPFSQLSTGRGGAGKTSPVLRSANELGLKVPRGIPGQVTGGPQIARQKRKRRAA